MPFEKKNDEQASFHVFGVDGKALDGGIAWTPNKLQQNVFQLNWVVLGSVITYQTRNHEGCVAAPLLDIIG